MKVKKDKVLTLLGIVYLTYWFFDFLYNAVMPGNYSWLLWYSATGLFLAGISFITQNIKLIYSMFCALFVIESLWLLDFLYVAISHQSLIGITEYMLSPTFKIKDLYFTLYHALIPIGLLVAIIRTKKVYAYGWIGAILFTTILVILTYFFTDTKSQVNCVHSINKCHTIFSFLYEIANPYRLIIALVTLTVFIFIPTNVALLYFKRNRKG